MKPSVTARLFSRTGILLGLLICAITVSNIRLSKHFWQYSIISDGRGYYAYLPAIFLYNDLHFGFYEQTDKEFTDAHNRADYRATVNGKTVNKYFCGTALLQTPFFLAAKISGAIAGDYSGYSKRYVAFMHLGALCWLGLGLFCLRKFLLRYHAAPLTATLICLIILFGTNLFYYVVAEPMMSHVYSFALISCFLLQSNKWMQEGKPMQLLSIAALLALIVLVRPVNGLIVLWLFVEAGSVQKLFSRIKESFQKPWSVICSALLFTAILSIQPIIWKVQTGSFFIDAYGEEGFRFGTFHFFDFLFSYRKGLFVYVPLTLLALVGLIPLYRENKTKAIFIALFLIVIIYILSSWWMWYYGGSFGPRVMIEYLPVFALLLFLCFNSLKKMVPRVSVAVITVLLVVFCQLQTLQYRYEIIHWSEMNKEKYWEVFLQLKK
ncbi:MAG: hypothetical protein MUC87_10060 [Bacteroidia bacterium]|jgi:hypothetical protein|nr:hypothetical protein [Bacteroidia bacterium]